MAAVMKTGIQPGSLIPPFELLSTEGQAVNIWQFKQRRNLVLAFVPSIDCAGCIKFLLGMARNYGQYEEERTAALIILRGDVAAAVELRDRLRAPFQIVYDERGHVTEQYSFVTPAVFVADRFGELKAEWLGRLPSQKEIMDVVELINLECPE